MSFSIKDYDLRDAFKIEKNLLIFSGFYPHRKSSGLFTKMRACLNISINISQLISMIIQLIIDRKDLSKISESLLYFVTLVTYLCKLANFGIYRNHLLDIEDVLTKSIFYDFNIEQLQQLKKKIDSCKMIAKIFRVLCVVAWLLYGLAPYLDEAKGDTLALPLPGWFPYNTTHFYYQTMAFQMLCVATTALNNSTIDILTWMLITVAAAQFNILKNKLKILDYRNNKETVLFYFHNCIRHHSEIVDLVHRIENIFSIGIFLQFCASVIVICSTGFQMIVVPILSVQFGFLIMYFLCMMWQVGIYCWYGHDLMTTSNEISNSFYISNWYESAKDLKKTICIFLEIAKKPTTLKAGNFVALSLTTFTAILRSSYSYFAVLQRLYKDA